MAYKKKSPEEVRAARMRAVAAMQAAKARKYEESVAAGTAGRKTQKQRGRATIEVYREDAKTIAEWAERFSISRPELVRHMVQDVAEKIEKHQEQEKEEKQNGK